MPVVVAEPVACYRHVHGNSVNDDDSKHDDGKHDGRSHADAAERADEAVHQVGGEAEVDAVVPARIRSERTIHR